VSPEDLADIINGAQQESPELVFKMNNSGNGTWLKIGLDGSDWEDYVIGWFPDES
jgi:hypothetical protein